VCAVKRSTERAVAARPPVLRIVGVDLCDHRLGALSDHERLAVLRKTIVRAVVLRHRRCAELLD
jgi:hypothetical protein